MLSVAVTALLCLTGSLWGWRAARPLKRQQEGFDRRWGARREADHADSGGGDGPAVP